MSFDINYSEFAEELKLLGRVNPTLKHYFISLVAAGTVVSAAAGRFVETSFDGTYEIWILSYLEERLEMCCRFENEVFRFSSIIRPRLPPV